MIDWEGEVKTREDLIMARMRQLDQRVLTEVQAAENLRNSRKANKIYYDQHKQLRVRGAAISRRRSCPSSSHQGFDYSRSRARKLDDRWSGPYRIREIPEDSTFYLLEELDGTSLANYFRWQSTQTTFSLALNSTIIAPRLMTRFEYEMHWRLRRNLHLEI